MLNSEVIDLYWLVLPHIVDSLLEWESSRVEAYQHVASEPLFNRLRQHLVIEAAYLDFGVLAQEVQNFSHGS